MRAYAIARPSADHDNGDGPNPAVRLPGPVVMRRASPPAELTTQSSVGSGGAVVRKSSLPTSNESLKRSAPLSGGDLSGSVATNAIWRPSGLHAYVSTSLRLAVICTASPPSIGITKTCCAESAASTRAGSPATWGPAPARPAARKASRSPVGEKRGVERPRLPRTNTLCELPATSTSTSSASQRFSSSFARATTTTIERPSGAMSGSLTRTRRDRSSSAKRRGWADALVGQVEERNDRASAEPIVLANARLRLEIDIVDSFGCETVAPPIHARRGRALGRGTPLCARGQSRRSVWLACDRNEPRAHHLPNSLGSAQQRLPSVEVLDAVRFPEVRFARQACRARAAPRGLRRGPHLGATRSRAPASQGAPPLLLARDVRSAGG